MTTPTDSLLEIVLSGLRDTCTDALVAAGIGQPDRRLLTHTAPPVDWKDDGGRDDLLAVYLERIEARATGERQPDSPGAAQAVGYHTVLLVRVEYHRCIAGLDSQGNAPEPAEVLRTTLELNRAGWAVWCELCARRDAGTLFPDVLGGALVTKRDVGIGSMAPIPPSGYSGGWKLGVEVAVPATFVDPTPGS